MRWRAGPSGVHFFDRNTGLNYLLDQVRLPPEQWATAPRHIAIALLNACDLSCAHCYAPKKSATLAPGKVFRWLSELDKNGCLGVGFGGGEPTLHPCFADICRYAANETGLAVTFTTHGHHLIDGRLASEIAGSVNFVRVSMDGVEQNYEAIRGRSFALLLRSLAVVGSIFRFGLNYVVNRRTLPDLDAAVLVAEDTGASELLLLPEMPVRGKGGIDPTSQLELAKWVRAYRGVVPLTVSEAGATDLPFCNPLINETGIRAYAHIDASEVLKHSSFDTGGVPIGEDGVLSALQLLKNYVEMPQ